MNAKMLVILNIIVTLQARCVKYDGTHPTDECPKPKEEPPKCTLLGGPHPANYL